MTVLQVNNDNYCIDSIQDIIYMLEDAIGYDNASNIKTILFDMIEHEIDKKAEEIDREYYREHELTIDHYSRLLIDLYNDIEELRDSVITAKRLNRQKIIDNLKYMHDTIGYEV